jgi:hypothetical protein
MTASELDPNPTPGDRQRAGMAVRAWAQDDIRMVGYLMADATERKRGFHFTAALLTELVEVLRLRGNEEAMAKLDQAIARYAEEQARLDQTESHEPD